MANRHTRACAHVKWEAVKQRQYRRPVDPQRFLEARRVDVIPFGQRDAIQMGKLLEEFNPLFYEEPIHSMNVDSLGKVSRNVNIPIAAGERIYTRYGFRQFIENQILDIAQPDIGLAGGITETKKIADYAGTYDINLQCHVCGSPVATAAAIQLEASIPNFFIHEYHVVSLNKKNRELVEQKFSPKGGYLEIPDAPGLGVELNEDVVALYPSIRVGSKE